MACDDGVFKAAISKDCSWSDVATQLSEDARSVRNSLSEHFFSKSTSPHTTGASDQTLFSLGYPTESPTRGAKEQQMNSSHTLEKFHETRGCSASNSSSSC